jgi:hypothetical protein
MRLARFGASLDAPFLRRATKFGVCGEVVHVNMLLAELNGTRDCVALVP